MTASRAGRGRDRRAETERPADPRTDTTPAIEIRDDGDRTNVVAESDDASLIIAWNSGEVGIDTLLDLLDDAERELRHQVRCSTSATDDASEPESEQKPEQEQHNGNAAEHDGGGGY